MSLHSVQMEDLLQPKDSKYRTMVFSTGKNEYPLGSSCASKSCPNISELIYSKSPSCGSLPAELTRPNASGLNKRAKIFNENFNNNVDYPCTPPPSPSANIQSQRNLVIISTLLVDPCAPNFQTTYDSVSFPHKRGIFYS